MAPIRQSRPHYGLGVQEIESGLVERGTARAEGAEGTLDQSHIPQSVLVYESERR